MDIISILGLVLGLAVLIMMGFKGWGMIPHVHRGRAGCRHHQPHGPLGGAEHPLRDLYEELCGRLLPDVFPGHAVRRTDGEQRCGQIHRL